MADPSAGPGVAVTGTLYHGCGIVDHTTRSLAPEMAVLVTKGRVSWLGPADQAPDPGPGVELVDAGGTTAVAGMVDAHSHLTLPGGSHWIDRASDSTPRLLAVAEHNARLLHQAGVRWARDVGAPVRDGRALSLTVRDRWRDRVGYPYVRAAGCWLAKTGSLPAQLPIEVDDGDGLLAAALGQLDDGADLVKLYMDGPDRDTSPFTASEVRQTVEAVHARGATVTAHSSLLAGARAAVAAGVDALEHGFQLDADLAGAMATQGGRDRSRTCGRCRGIIAVKTSPRPSGLRLAHLFSYVAAAAWRPWRPGSAPPLAPTPPAGSRRTPAPSGRRRGRGPPGAGSRPRRSGPTTTISLGPLRFHRRRVIAPLHGQADGDLGYWTSNRCLTRAGRLLVGPAVIGRYSS